LSPSGKRVLVGDADEIVLALILHILQRQGYQVDVTTRPDVFSEKLRNGNYHAVLVDPNVSPQGVKWIKTILADFPGLCSRMIIAAARPKHDLAVYATLPKPLEFGLLISTVEACCVQK
jgi:DNA-binding NtrC family response regulator